MNLHEVGDFDFRRRYLFLQVPKNFINLPQSAYKIVLWKEKKSFNKVGTHPVFVKPTFFVTGETGMVRAL